MSLYNENERQFLLWLRLNHPTLYRGTVTVAEEISGEVSVIADEVDMLRTAFYAGYLYADRKHEATVNGLQLALKATQQHHHYPPSLWTSLKIRLTSPKTPTTAPRSE